MEMKEDLIQFSLLPVVGKCCFIENSLKTSKVKRIKDDFFSKKGENKYFRRQSKTT